MIAVRSGWAALMLTSALAFLSFAFVSFALFPFALLQSMAQAAEPARNITVLDTLAHRTTRALAANVLHHFQTRSQEAHQSQQRQQPQRFDTLHCLFPDHPGSWLVEQYLPTDVRPVVVRRARASEVSFSSTSSASSIISGASAGLLRLRFEDCAVRYFVCDHADDSLTREIQIILVSGIESASGVMTALPNASAVHRDTVARRTVPALESKQYEFAQGTVPEQVGGFWKTVVEPIVVIAAAAITVILLFTVRTQ